MIERIKMNIKPKDIRVNLPIVLGFDDPEEIPKFAATINTIIHGKVKIKCEELGVLGAQYMGLFYMQRNNEYQELRDEFIEMIDKEISIEQDTNATIINRRREKQESRESDTQALVSGEKTREQLRLENHVFAGRKLHIIFPSKKNSY